LLSGLSPTGTGMGKSSSMAEVRRVSVIQRTLQGLSGALTESVFTEQIAARPGLLQRTDPRAKALCLLGLLIVAALVHTWQILLAMYLLTLILAGVSNISIAFFIKRVWLFIPIFAGIIVLPSLFSVFRTGDPLWMIWDFGHEVTFGPWSLGTSLAITKQGLAGAALLILRVAVSVSLAVLLALTTRWANLLKALRVFFVPRIFILILSLTYRYIFLLLAIASDMFTARRSRMVGPSSPREDRRFVASSMGTLLGKSHTMSDEIYSAMVSRGYTGEPRSTHRFHMRVADWAISASAAMVAIAVITGDRLFC